MNLNFIQDNDKIHVETQNQIAYKQEIILKMKLLKQDFSDYSQINPSLTDINLLFSDIVKDLYEHVTNCKLKTIQSNKNSQPNEISQNQPVKKKKKVSISYGIVRKLQTLKNKFIICRKIIQNQNFRYHSLNVNTQNQKKSDVKFYKSVLQSYENQRQYFKKSTLELEDRVQQVQAVVKTLSYNDNHSFTDFDSKVITYQSIFKYQKKRNAFQKVLDEVNLIAKTKQKISKALEIGSNSQNQTQNRNTTQSLVYSKNMVQSIEQMQRRINLLKRQNIQIVQNQLLKLKEQKNKIETINKKLKKAILQNQSQKYFRDMEIKVKNCQLHSTNQKKGPKMTTTDFMIYLKELDARIKDQFKSKEIVYRCKKLLPASKISIRSKSAHISKF